MIGRTNTIFATSLVVTTMSVLMFVWILFEINSNANDIKRTVAELAEIDKKNNHARAMGNLLDNTKTEREKLDKLFVDEEDIVNLLQEIERLGSYAGTGVSITSIQDTKDKMLITTSFSGSYAQLRYFVDFAENIPYAVFINSLRFTKQKRGDLWQASLELVVLK